MPGPRRAKRPATASPAQSPPAPTQPAPAPPGSSAEHKPSSGTPKGASGFKLPRHVLFVSCILSLVTPAQACTLCTMATPAYGHALVAHLPALGDDAPAGRAPRASPTVLPPPAPTVSPLSLLERLALTLTPPAVLWQADYIAPVASAPWPSAPSMHPPHTHPGLGLPLCPEPWEPARSPPPATTPACASSPTPACVLRAHCTQSRDADTTVRGDTLGLHDAPVTASPARVPVLMTACMNQSARACEQRAPQKYQTSVYTRLLHTTLHIAWTHATCLLAQFAGVTRPAVLSAVRPRARPTLYDPMSHAHALPALSPSLQALHAPAACPRATLPPCHAASHTSSPQEIAPASLRGNTSAGCGSGLGSGRSAGEGAGRPSDQITSGGPAAAPTATPAAPPTAALTAALTTAPTAASTAALTTAPAAAHTAASAAARAAAPTAAPVL